MKRLFFFIIVTAFPAFSFAQDTIFIKSYGQIGYNYGEKVIQTADTGYMILGNKSGFVGNSDVYLAKTNFCGNIEWDKAYGGTEVNWAEDMVRTKDKGYAIAGYMTLPSENNDYDIMLIKTDSLGVMQWMKHYGGSNWDLGHSLIETPDSGFIIAGETYSFGNGNNDAFFMKTNKDGDSLWSKWYGGQGEDIAYDVNICHDGTILAAGVSNSFGIGGYDIYLLKLSPTGDTLWTRTYGDTLDDYAFSLIEDYTHGIVIAGSTRNYNAIGLDGMLLKTDSAGSQLWYQTYGYPGTGDEECYDLVQNKDHGFMLAGYTSSFSFGSKDFYMILTNPDGWFITGTTFGGSKEDYARACINTSDNGYAIVGTTESMGLGLSNILFVKVDSNGHSNLSTYIHITDIPKYSDEIISVYPNPVIDILNILISSQNIRNEITIYNQQGQIVYNKISQNKISETVDFSNLPEGIYIFVLNNGDNLLRKKIIHIHQ